MKVQITAAIQFRGDYRRPMEGHGEGTLAAWAANRGRREMIPSLYRDYMDKSES